jgi:hypothetical protein
MFFTFPKVNLSNMRKRSAEWKISKAVSLRSMSSDL